MPVQNRKAVISLLLPATCLFFYIYGNQSRSRWIPMLNIEESHCYTEKRHDTKIPLCENLLANITDGRWISKTQFVKKDSLEYEDLLKEEEEYDAHLANVRIARGIHVKLWREDGKCGFQRFRRKPPGSTWPMCGSWCDARSDAPCCSDQEDGFCGQNCDCDRCVDMRKLHHAELCDWILRDSRCKLKTYSTKAACDIVNKFRSIHFVGDSFIRKFARAFILALKNNLVTGAQMQSYSNKTAQLCTGQDQFYYRECNMPFGNLSHVLKSQSAICGKSLEQFSSHIDFFADSARFHNVVKSLAGKEKTVIILGVGVHMDCTFKIIKDKFMNPAISYLKKYQINSTGSHLSRWPHIIFIPPDTSSLLKPYRALRRNGNIVCEKYTASMINFCKEHDIPVLNFRRLTQGVHSYDGTHYGLGVNLMKFQLLFHYLDQFINEYLEKGS